MQSVGHDGSQLTRSSRMATENPSVGDGSVPGGTTNTDTRAALPRLASPALFTAELPLRDGSLTVRALIDLYMRQYAGRDTSRLYRLRWWAAKLDDISLADLSDDHVHSALETLARQPSRYFAGQDADGRAIHRAKRKLLSPASINRYAASLAAVITWAIKRRIAPKGYVHPCRSIERRPENNERVRFLSDEERARLLAACRASRWEHLHLLVLLALTTGARKGELMALRWQDIDLERQVALCDRSKNGDPKVLPLLEPVLQLLRASPGKPAHLVFGSPRNPLVRFNFEKCWREALAAARLRDFRFHDLRHSCASMLAQHGATLLEIADVLGHRQLQMTKRYSHLTTAHKAALIKRVWEERCP
ncbi:site-specific integrase [Ramlibacter tataouinensis]|uniref:tyrosine-type recombinase/integrase n=1 Tax=Ramlibacter tataouinensis TaxID=94132 RepID=UPI0022F3E14F|nr:site-specific integrase [Ramlibacter tataouinensis]WBY02757.1 site-specific integrase [Ramlibacter tataouinensis]